MCHFGESDISDLFLDGRFVPTTAGFIDVLIQPDERMLATDGACPRQESDRFIHVHGMSPGLFRTVFEAYAQLWSSPSAFDAALADVNGRDLTTAFIASLKQAMQGQFGTVPRVSSVVYAPAFFGASTVGSYSVTMTNGWQLQFEFTQAGLKVVDLYLLNM